MSDKFKIVDDTEEADPDLTESPELEGSSPTATPPVVSPGLFSPEQSANLYRLIHDRSIGLAAVLLYVGYVGLLLIGLIPAFVLLLSLVLHGSAAMTFYTTYNGQRTDYRSPEWVGYFVACICALVPWLLANTCLRVSRVLFSLRRIAKGR